MIDRQEVMDYSRELGLAPNIIEKDYVLGWLLIGIGQEPSLSKHWILKGGTCLKKCFFETYRFSEDLDFTLTEHSHLDEQFLNTTFREVASWIYDNSGIEFPEDTFRFETYTNPRGNPAVEGRLGYRGPMRIGGDLPRIRLDLTDDELVVLPPVTREVLHSYSDGLGDAGAVQTYPFEEMFAEKLRALAERLRPRDLYDVVHVYRRQDVRPVPTRVMNVLKEKCRFKGIPVPTFELLERRPERSELKQEWENMLAHQLPILPPVEQFWSVLPEVFRWLHGEIEEKVLKPIPIRQAVDTSWQPPAMVQTWNTSTPVETIRYAAANHLCVNLGYGGDYRLIEPYSLRRTRAGNLLLQALRHDSGENRAYRVDRIEGAEVTTETFVPKYAIELSTSGSISAPRTARRTVPRNIWRSGPSGPKYVVECPCCGRHFDRKKRRTRLRLHKDTYGYPCSGRSGHVVDTKY